MEDSLIASNAKIDNIGLARSMKKLMLKSCPVILSEVFQFLIRTMNLIAAGKIDKYLLDGVGVGLIFFSMAGPAISYGLAGGLDTVSSHAYGQGEFKRVGIWLQRALLAITIYVLLAIGLFWNSESILLAAKFDPIVAAYAAEYMKFQLPGLWFFMAIDSYRRFLQVQGYFWPYMASLGTATVLHAFWVYLFVIVLDLGGAGIGISCSITFFISFLNLLGTSLCCDISKCKQKLSTKNIVSDMLIYYKYAVPTILNFLLGFGCFEANQYLASFLGIDSLAALFSLISIEGTVFMIPLGLSITTSIFIGKALGKGKPKTAKTYARGGLLLSVLTLMGPIVIYASTVKFWATAFTSDQGVIQVMTNTVLLAAIMTLITGFNEVIFGILRGLGKQYFLTVNYSIGFYLFGLPTSYIFTQIVPFDLNGIMLGLIVGSLCAIAPSAIAILRIKWKTIEQNH